MQFNCKNLKTSYSIDEIKELCTLNDFILLRVTWHLEEELTVLSQLTPVNISAGRVVGRPHGGLAILWHKNIGQKCIVEISPEEKKGL